MIAANFLIYRRCQLSQFCYKWYTILNYLLTVPGPVEGDKVKATVQLGSDVGITFTFPVQSNFCPCRNDLIDNFIVIIASDLSGNTNVYSCGAPPNSLHEAETAAQIHHCTRDDWES